MSAWTLAYERFDPDQEKLREALCTLGNGYFATRGAAPEAHADEVHYPGTYVAGVYNRLATDIAGRTVVNEDLVNTPNWLPLAFRIDGGDWFRLTTVDLLDYRQELDLRRGVLIRALEFRDPEGRHTKVTQRRFVHMRDPHLAALETTFLAVDWSGRLEVRSAIDGRVHNRGVARYQALRGDHLNPIESGGADDLIYLLVETNQSRVRIAEAARTRLRDDDAVERRLIEEAGYVAHEVLLPFGRPSRNRGEGRGPLHVPGPGHLRVRPRRPPGGAPGRGVRPPPGASHSRLAPPVATLPPRC